MRGQMKPVVVEDGYIKVNTKNYLISDYVRCEVADLSEKQTFLKEIQRFLPGSILMWVSFSVPLIWAIAMFIWPEFRIRNTRLGKQEINPILILSIPVCVLFWSYLSKSENSKDARFNLYHLSISNKRGKFYIYSSSDRSEIEKYVREIHLCMSSKSSVSS
jgi:hypothetical protein